MGREGFEPPKAIGRQIYSLVQLTALPPALCFCYRVSFLLLLLHFPTQPQSPS